VKYEPELQERAVAAGVVPPLSRMLARANTSEAVDEAFMVRRCCGRRHRARLWL
jgi:hypothetical protein